MQFWPSLISIRKWFSKHRSRQDPESSCKMRNMHHGCGIANNMPGGTCMKRAKTSNRFGIIKNLEFHFLTGSLLQPRIASLLCWCREWPSRIFPGRSWFPVAETWFFPPLGLAGLAARCHDSNGIHRWIRIAINSWFTVDSRLFVARLPGKYIYIYIIYIYIYIYYIYHIYILDIYYIYIIYIISNIYIYLYLYLYEFPLGLTPRKRLDFIHFWTPEIVWMMRNPSLLHFLENNFWRPLSRKMLIFWMV